MAIQTMWRTIFGGALGAALVSCAGADPVSYSLTGTVWQVESIDRGGIVDRSMVTLDFSEEGRVGGKGSCNRYFSSVTVDGATISFGNAGSTMLACAEPLMKREMRFFEALSEAATFSIEDNQWLVISDAQGEERIRALRVDSDPTATRPEVMDKGSDVSHAFVSDTLGPVSFRFVGPETIALTIGDTPEQILIQERSASGARYTNETLEFWSKGDEAMLTVDGVRHTCKAVES